MCVCVAVLVCGYQYPVNATAQPEVLAQLIEAANAHTSSVVPGVSQYEALDWSIMPCCDKTYNVTVGAHTVAHALTEGHTLWHTH